ncbi:hypothetical protein R1917_00515 [Citrobacter koseri]|uniref:hypothetical protein n=1 Tax=Citrobacter koseri TaxID=545 RepID=UPI002942D99B|nr:hypothetical protein [Citrobacter koseri]WOJ33165.1 hypothetical protein R1917_00515 [Citrobacter koseri]WOJ37795.1 hypothetical protein R1243_21575 [Citrobacter koseri]
MQGWGDDHLHQFHLYGKDYGISYDGGTGFPDNPFQIVIGDFDFDVGGRFTHEYNFFEHYTPLSRKLPSYGRNALQV